jgi:salicylate hydroxylase
MTNKLRIAIVGGGIGGLAAALALRARGLEATVFEQADALREIGAGLSLGPNTGRLLERIGLGEGLRTLSAPESQFMIRTWRGEPVAMIPTPHSPKGERGYMIHRADLLNLLASALPDGVVRLDHRCVGAETVGGTTRVFFSNGTSIEADIVIGADGIGSVMQRAIGVNSHPKSEGIMAYRGLIPVERLSWAKDASIAMWVGTQRSFLCYAVSQGRLMNMVAFVPTDRDAEERWSAPGEIKALAAEYAGWDAPVLETIGALDETFRWGIYDRAPLPYWSTDRMTLLGDAAHPMVPHLGQGAGQAIEDGFALAVLLEDADADDVPARLRAYEGLRLEHTSGAQAHARTAGMLFRAEDQSAEACKKALGSLMAQGRWITDHDAEHAAKEMLKSLRAH